MSRGLRRFQESGQSHFVTFSCYRRQPFFSTAETYDLFVQCLEDTRCRLEMCIYGYAVMPEHVHLLLSEPPRTRLADAIHYLKLSFAKRLRSQRSPEKSAGFWQKRYYDRNVRSYPGVCGEVALPSSKSSETWASFQTSRIGSGAATAIMRFERLGS